MGIGVHTDLAYVGTVGSKDGVNEIVVLGSAANLVARLSSQAASGEILTSDETYQSAGLDMDKTKNRTLDLKGISNPVSVKVMSSPGA